MKKIMFMAAVGGMLLSPAASRAVLVTNISTNYAGVTTYATNYYQQVVTLQGQACFVVEGKLSRGQANNETIRACAFSTKDVLAAAGIPNGAGKLIRETRRFTETLNFTNCFTTTVISDVINGVCSTNVSVTFATNPVSGTKCWIYSSVDFFDDDQDDDDDSLLFAVSANGQNVKLLNSTNGPRSSAVDFSWYADSDDIFAYRTRNDGVGTVDFKSICELYVDTSGDISNKLWKVDRSSFELENEYYATECKGQVRSVFNNRTKCLETTPATGTMIIGDTIRHYFPNPCGSGRASDFGIYKATLRIGPSTVKAASLR